MSLINCEISLILTWTKNCVLTDEITHDATPVERNAPQILAINAPTNQMLKIEDTKFYVLVVTLLTQDVNNKLLEQLKT